MTVSELKKKLNAIPPNGAINKGRREAIILMIDRLLKAGAEG